MAIIPGETQKGVSIETPQQQKTKKLLTILIIVILIAMAVIYFGFGGSGSPSPAVSTNTTTPAEVEQIDKSNKLLDSLSKTELDNPIFKDNKFEEMVLSDRLPIVVGEKGRDNPFIPF